MPPVHNTFPCTFHCSKYNAVFMSTNGGLQTKFVCHQEQKVQKLPTTKHVANSRVLSKAVCGWWCQPSNVSLYLDLMKAVRSNLIISYLQPDTVAVLLETLDVYCHWFMPQALVMDPFHQSINMFQSAIPSPSMMTQCLPVWPSRGDIISKRMREFSIGTVVRT